MAKLIERWAKGISMYRYLIVDAMVNGTGIRDQFGDDGYIEPEILGLSPFILQELLEWHSKYKEQFYTGYEDEDVVLELDKIGLKISKAIQNELVDSKIIYFSDATMTQHIL